MKLTSLFAPDYGRQILTVSSGERPSQTCCLSIRYEKKYFYFRTGAAAQGSKEFGV